MIVATPERISEIADTLVERIQHSIRSITEITLQTRILSVNAQIEAGRAGSAGGSFRIVGQEMVVLSERTKAAAERIEQDTHQPVRELADISRTLATHVRGTRLCDLARTNIDLIDRNLYERSCDVRWWATDGAAVDALASNDPAKLRHASRRLGVILKAYTVYFDIVLADLNGRIVANGRPETYASVGQYQAGEPWFENALKTAHGDEFGFQSAHRSSLVNQQPALVYSCKVCQGGDARGKPVGVLGVVFNWDGLAKKIIDETPLEPEQQARTQVCITDSTGAILVGSRAIAGEKTLVLPGLDKLMAEKKNSTMLKVNGRNLLVAHAQSPGFETYRTGWHSFIIEALAS